MSGADEQQAREKGRASERSQLSPRNPASHRRASKANDCTGSSTWKKEGVTCPKTLFASFVEGPVAGLGLGASCVHSLRCHIRFCWIANRDKNAKRSLDLARIPAKPAAMQIMVVIRGDPDPVSCSCTFLP